MSGPAGLVAGVITVAFDGTYTAVPALGPFNVPATATSLAQARFEARFPGIVAKMTASVQAQVIDATTTPPTTNKGNVMIGLADDINAEAAADVGYIANNSVATVAINALAVPTPNTAGTTFPPAAVKLPVT